MCEARKGEARRGAEKGEVEREARETRGEAGRGARWSEGLGEARERRGWAESGARRVARARLQPQSTPYETRPMLPVQCTEPWLVVQILSRELWQPLCM